MKPFPIIESIASQLQDLHNVRSNVARKKALPDNLYAHIRDRVLEWYERELLTENYSSRNKLKLANPRQTLIAFLDAGEKAIAAFRDNVPEWAFQETATSSTTVTKLLDLRDAHVAVATALMAKTDELRSVGLVSNDHWPLYYRDFDEPAPTFDEREPYFSDQEPIDSEDKVQWRNDRRYFEAHEYADWKESKRQFEQQKIPAWKERKRQYEKKQKEFFRERLRDERAFIGTPFYDFWLMLKPELEINVPFVIDPAVRLAHQFVVSPSRSGKTTFLISQILQDIDRVIKGECSIVAMDSENELIPDIAKLAIFGPGGDLDGKLIYLEPTKYPLALNIFDRGDTTFSGDADEAYRDALTTTQFFINSIGKTEVSGHQDIILKFAIQALMSLPNPTLADLRDLLQEKTGFAKYKDAFVKLDSDVARVVEKDFFSDYKASTTAVRGRVTGMIADPLFRKVFSQNDNRLDLFKELQNPKVVLVSTAGLGDATGPFGRFIIAKLNEAVMKRKFIPKSSKLPIYCYIDEASYYIPEEPLFADMLNRVAKQGLGLTIATQHEQDITNAKVLAVLKGVAIQCQTRKPFVNISIDNAATVTVNVPLINLTQLPQMSVTEQAAIREDMKERFGPLNNNAPETQPAIIAEPNGPPVTPTKPTPKVGPGKIGGADDGDVAQPWRKP